MLLSESSIAGQPIRAVSSIITNRSALRALQAADAAGRQLTAVQNRVSTGLKVARPSDNAAIFAIAQNMRADVGGWKAVTASLDRGQSSVDIASVGSESVSDLMVELRARALAYGDPSNAGSKSLIRADMEALLRQINQVAENSTFDGVNLLTGRPSMKTDSTYRYALPPSTMAPPGFATTMAALPPGSSAHTTQVPVATVISGPLTPPSFTSALSTFSGSNSQTIPVNAGTTPGRVTFLLNAYSAPDIVEIWQNGTRVAATGQPPASGGAGVNAGSAVSGQRALIFDYDPVNGQNLEFRVNENVNVTGTVWRVEGLVLSQPPHPVIEPQIETKTDVRAAAEFDPPRPVANPEEVALALGTPPVGNVATHIIDGGSQAGRVDVLFDAYDRPDKIEILQGGQVVAASGQGYMPGGNPVGPGVAVAGAQVVSFDYDPLKGPITFRFNNGVSDPDSAWAVGAVTLRPTTDPVPSIPATPPAGFQTPGFSPVNYDFLSAPGGSAIRVSSRDLTPLGLGLDPLDWEDPTQILAAIEDAENTVIEAGSYFGAQRLLLEATRGQAGRTIDRLESGVGNLVDADLGKESARLQAAQVKQQLATQALAIANRDPQWMLTLFKK